MSRRYVLRAAVSLAIFAGAACGASFAWRPEAGRWVLTDAGKPVLVYNEAMQLPSGVPEDRRRCCYVHPLYTPSGVVVTEDFPADHYHHRGLFWAWPHVRTADGDRDLWLMKGVRQESVKVRARGGVLTAANRWLANGRAIVRERVRLEALPLAGGSRHLLVELQIEALSETVWLEGSREEGKSYGGLSIRFAPRENTTIRTDAGLIQKDEDLLPHTWAEMTASYGGNGATVRVESEQGPQQWCLRHYGFIGASFPGRTAERSEYRLEPGKPLVLRYRVAVSDDQTPSLP